MDGQKNSVNEMNTTATPAGPTNPYLNGMVMKETTLATEAAHASHVDDVKTAAGVVLGADLVVFHAVPLTLTGGVAQGFARQGETRFYFRTGLSF